MRLYMLFLTLLCSLHLAAQVPMENDIQEIDSLDYVSLFQMSQSLLLDACGDRLVPILEHGDENVILEPANDEEFKQMLLAMFSYYVGLIRLRQEIACLRNPEMADDLLESVLSWQGVLGYLPLVTAQVTVECVKQWAETEIDRPWKPQDNLALYRPAFEWSKLRRKAALELIQAFEAAFERAVADC